MAFAAFTGTSGSPLAGKIETIKHLLGRDIFERTALSDSYSSCVGAGNYISNSYRCLRYDQAYSQKINGHKDSPMYTNDLQARSVSRAAQDNNACHGISGDFWVMSRDVAVENAKAFCSQTEKTVTYNQGSVNELSLSVRKPGNDSKVPTDAPDCVGRFQNAVIDGCDGADAVNNPHNYKFGSVLTTADGWEYKMTPLSKQVNEVSCDVSYKFLWDAIEIRGKDLPDAKLGADGEGLRQQLSGCGALTEWQFEQTPDDAKFQWYASCRLPVGTKDCVGVALMSAGGADKGNCQGVGKRAANVRRRSSGIEDWPGYGDESKHVFRKPAVEQRASIVA